MNASGNLEVMSLSIFVSSKLTEWYYYHMISPIPKTDDRLQ
jgi:hypothetical protein